MWCSFTKPADLVSDSVNISFISFADAVADRHLPLLGFRHSTRVRHEQDRFETGYWRSHAGGWSGWNKGSCVGVSNTVII